MKVVLALLMVGLLGCSTVDKVETAVDKGLQDVKSKVTEYKEAKKAVVAIPENIRKSFKEVATTSRKFTTMVVHEGDTLWALAWAEYGDPFLWPAVYKANRDTLESPHLILTGQTLDYPNYLTLREMEVFRDRAYSE